jgi:hypothetical protein
MRLKKVTCQNRVRSIKGYVLELTDGVGEGEPERAEDHPSAEVHARKDTTSEKNDCNCSEDELEVNQSRHGKFGYDICGWNDSL